MAERQTLEMTVATRKDFHFLGWVVFMLVVLSASISAYPLFLLMLSILLLLTARKLPATVSANIPSQSNTVSITRDGQISILSIDDELTHGELLGVQWCIRHLAILRFRSNNVIRHIVLIAVDQSPESFRQLCVWLRHNNSKEGRNQ